MISSFLASYVTINTAPSRSRGGSTTLTNVTRGSVAERVRDNVLSDAKLFSWATKVDADCHTSCKDRSFLVRAVAYTSR